MGGSPSISAASQPSASPLYSDLMHLIGQSMAPRSWHTYHRAWGMLHSFLVPFHLSPTLPVSAIHMAFFLTYLWEAHYSPATVATYMSAIGFLHKLHGFHDPSDNFLVQRALKGIQKTSRVQDTRLPITYSILGNLMHAVKYCSSVLYCQVMYRSMFSLAFFAFLRVGELTVSNAYSHNILTLQQLKFDRQKRFVTVVFLNFKHSNGRKAVVKIFPQQDCEICPVRTLYEFLALRGTAPGFLYQWPSGAAISRQEFIDILNRCLAFCNLSCSVYKGHSFRIGAATYCASLGMSDSQIRTLGRWRSDAFKKYIRLS